MLNQLLNALDNTQLIKTAQIIQLISKLDRTEIINLGYQFESIRGQSVPQLLKVINDPIYRVLSYIFTKPEDLLQHQLQKLQFSQSSSDFIYLLCVLQILEPTQICDVKARFQAECNTSLKLVMESVTCKEQNQYLRRWAVSILACYRNQDDQAVESLLELFSNSDVFFDDALRVCNSLSNPQIKKFQTQLESNMRSLDKQVQLLVKVAINRADGVKEAAEYLLKQIGDPRLKELIYAYFWEQKLDVSILEPLSGGKPVYAALAAFNEQ